MTTFTQHLTTTFHVVTCYSCGIPFGITGELHRRVVVDAIGSVSCPACGQKTCWRESEDQKEIRRLKSIVETANRRAETSSRRADAAEARATSEQNRRIAMKGVVTKLKKRVSNGVCPCCNRYFANLHRHMTNQHPDYPSA